MNDAERAPELETKRLFTYYPQDFAEQAVRVVHMDLTFDLHDDHTRVLSRLHGETLAGPVGRLALNAKNLEILSVRAGEREAAYTYDREASILSITFDPPVPPRTPFVVTTETVCRPSHHVLEGLYYDATPDGAPPQQITQCQQWGFQRLVPCIDEMTAKCTYRTTINADARYTNLITNGDVAVPRHPIGGGRDSITYENLITPMAPYLFFLGAGTYATFIRPFEYPDGSRFTLELLVPPGSDPARAEAALEILADAVLWVYLFTGPDQYRNIDQRMRIYELSKERDRLRAEEGSEQAAAGLRRELADRITTIVPGYRYTGTVYREIGMQNSDFGGMENVGNTTITTNRIMPFPQITDPAFEYMVRVKVHEYYHNLNGSEVTGMTPFEIWLNEAVTVHVENQYQAFHFGEDYCRLQTVLSLLSPAGGTFFYDRGAGSMPIEPDGFNDPNDLITGVTYVKAPEFVRMIETRMGREAFARGLDRYHRRYAHGNATRAEWIEAMEEESGLSFGRMAEQWLKQTGYPDVHATSAYDPALRTLTLELEQRSGETDDVWEFPFALALVDADGTDIAGTTVLVQERKTAVVFEDVPEPAFLSLNRGYSFYGKVFHPATDAELLLQVEKDSDAVNRYMAFFTLTDREKRRLLEDPDAQVSETITGLYASLLSREEQIEQLGAEFLTIFESVDDERFAHRYRALHAARQKILRATAEAHAGDLAGRYRRYRDRIADSGDLPEVVRAIKYRQAANTCLALLATLDTPEVHGVVRDQFERSVHWTDRIAAFVLYLNSSAPDRLELLGAFEEEARQHPVAWEAFLASVASASSDDCVGLVRRVAASPGFRIEQANDQRALFGRFAQNKKVSLQTEEGRAFFREMLGKLAVVNEYSTVNALSVLGNIDRMEEEYHVPLVDILVGLIGSLDAKETPSVYNTARRLLIGAPKARTRYERERGVVISGVG
jgi:aminopeptidase N